MTGGDLGMHYNSFTWENSWRIEHGYKRHMVHIGDELWSLEVTIISGWQTEAGTPVYAEHDAAGCFKISVTAVKILLYYKLGLLTAIWISGCRWFKSVSGYKIDQM